MIINGKIKSGYIFHIMTDKVKKYLHNSLNHDEIQMINMSINNIDKLSTSQKINILNEFIEKIKAITARKASIIDNSLVFSLICISILIIGSYVYSQIKFKSVNRTVDFIEAILNNGGMHLIVLPYVWGVIRAEYNINPFKLLMDSKNFFFDILLSICVAPLIALLFAHQAVTTNFFTNPVLNYFSILIALLIGPALEELFFRFYLFRMSGKRYGYLFCGFVSSLLFAAVHIPESPYLFFSYFIAGIMLCGIYYFRRSLLPSLISHSLANLFILLF